MGQTITYTYTVTNTSSADSPALINVRLTDDHGTPRNRADDFTPAFTGGDADSDGQLDPGETWIFTRTHEYRTGDANPLVNRAEVHANPIGFPNDHHGHRQCRGRGPDPAAAPTSSPTSSPSALETGFPGEGR